MTRAKRGLAATFLTYFAGGSLKERRWRMFCLVGAAPYCLQIPWGTVIGACPIIVLNGPSVRALADPATVRPPAPYLSPGL